MVALITMSISVALTVLVPLVAKRYVKVDHVLPYILGANITTLGDTMIAAFALDSPSAVRIVLAEVIATSALSLILLAFFYDRSSRRCGRCRYWARRAPGAWWSSRSCSFCCPITIIGVSSLFG